jgi:hypothetical protein
LERQSGHYNTFVVRIWSEEAAGRLRGQIQHIATQDKGSFDCLEVMNRFVLNHLGAASALAGMRSSKSRKSIDNVSTEKELRDKRRIK